MLINLNPSLLNRRNPKRLDKATIDQVVAIMRSGYEYPPVQVSVIEGRYVYEEGASRVAASKRLNRHVICILS